MLEIQSWLPVTLWIKSKTLNLFTSSMPYLSPRLSPSSADVKNGSQPLFLRLSSCQNDLSYDPGVVDFFLLFNSQLTFPRSREACFSWQPQLFLVPCCFCHLNGTACLFPCFLKFLTFKSDDVFKSSNSLSNFTAIYFSNAQNTAWYVINSHHGLIIDSFMWNCCFQQWLNSEKKKNPC